MRKLLVACLVCSLSSAYGRAWPTYHGNADLRGVASDSLPDQPERVWQFNTNGRVENTPVFDGERIYVACGKGRVAALSRSGMLLWEKTFTRVNAAGAEMPLQFNAPLLCHGGMLLAGSSRGILIALDGATGKERWRLDIDGMLLGSPNIVDDWKVIILDQGGGALHCVDTRCGKVWWKTDEVERSDGSPGVGNGHVVFGSCLSALHVYDAADGRHLRNVDIDGEGEIAGGVAVDGRKAFCGTRDGRLICVDVDAGTVVWTSSESADQTFSTPAVNEDRVVYASDNGWVYAVDRATGRTLWKFDTGGLPSSPVIAGRQVLVGADGQLYMLGLSTGNLLWKKAISDDITSPAIIDGCAVVGADDGTVSAWGRVSPAEDPNNGAAK